MPLDHLYDKSHAELVQYAAILESRILAVIDYADSCDRHGGFPSTVTIREYLSVQRPEGDADA